MRKCEHGWRPRVRGCDHAADVSLLVTSTGKVMYLCAKHARIWDALFQGAGEDHQIDNGQVELFAECAS